MTMRLKAPEAMPFVEKREDPRKNKPGMGPGTSAGRERRGGG